MSKFDQHFFKLMTNSTVGKLCESLRNRVSVEFIPTEDKLLKATSKGCISSKKVIYENLKMRKLEHQLKKFARSNPNCIP